VVEYDGEFLDSMAWLPALIADFDGCRTRDDALTTKLDAGRPARRAARHGQRAGHAVGAPTKPQQLEKA
jgi:hypothetical protein